MRADIPLEGDSVGHIIDDVSRGCLVRLCRGLVGFGKSVVSR